jgi:hypothetical protein
MMKTGTMGDGRRWEANVNAQRTRCEWTLYEAAPRATVVASGTITIAANKYMPHVSSGTLLAADQQELLIYILDDVPELRELV